MLYNQTLDLHKQFLIGILYKIDIELNLVSFGDKISVFPFITLLSLGIKFTPEEKSNPISPSL
jgi:hypothetical protein